MGLHHWCRYRWLPRGGFDVSGGLYFGYQNGSIFGGVYGSGSTGFEYGAGAGVQGTYYLDASNICGSSVNYNGNLGPVSGMVVTDTNTGAITGYGGGLGVGSPRGGSITFGNTGTFDGSVQIGPIVPEPTSHMGAP